MEIYQTENEQEESLRRWWEANGKSFLIITLLLLAAVIGWQQWDAHQKGQAAAASQLYETINQVVVTDITQAVELGRGLMAQQPNSHYATLTALLLAKAEVERGDLKAAEAQLQWVINQNSDPAFVRLATLRMARVLLAQGRGNEGLLLLDQDKTLDTETFAGLANEVRGDIHLAQGDKAQARDAYRKAQETLANTSGKSRELQLKLDDLAVAN
ncbi:MAG: tetratricopeptide repeat protein [Gammaproteobacteria bacterium]|nr:tetratricopeptide repeat protein [Gammaproteobacteria bacterium]